MKLRALEESELNLDKMMPILSSDRARGSPRIGGKATQILEHSNVQYMHAPAMTGMSCCTVIFFPSILSLVPCKPFDDDQNSSNYCNLFT